MMPFRTHRPAGCATGIFQMRLTSLLRSSERGCPSLGSERLGQQLVNDVAADIRQAEVASLKLERKFLVVQSE